MIRRGLLKLDGRISISRTSGGSQEFEDCPVRIEVTDNLSHCRIVEIRMSLEAFANAVFSHYESCTVEYYDVATIGMRAENKTDLVPFDMFTGRDNEAAQSKALKSFEVDGWKARRSDLQNGHCAVQEGTKRFQRVVFFRHVDPTTGEPLL